MTSASLTRTLEKQDAPAGRARPARRFSWAWLGVAPFFIFAFLFLFLPSLSLFVGIHLGSLSVFWLGVTGRDVALCVGLPARAHVTWDGGLLLRPYKVVRLQTDGSTEELAS